MDDREITKELEVIEAASRDNPKAVTESDFNLAMQFIDSENNAQKREASRVVGNGAVAFPNKLNEVIPKLLQNTKDTGTVVRWSAAYALGRIVALPEYANSDLFDTVTKLAANETDNGIKNQYLAGLKKAEKQRTK